MVQRQSQPVEFGQSTVAVQGAQIGNARPDADKFYSPTSQGGDSSDLLGSLLNVVAPIAKNLAFAKIGVDREEAYLAGAAAAATGQVESELEANGLTANWKTAGFRDTATKLKAADQDAQLAVDMEELKTKSPEKFAEYLAKRREAIAPDLEGMSLDARKAMFAQQLTTERAAIKEHGLKHGAWITDQRTKTVRQTVSTSLANLGRAVKTTDAYAAATDSTFAAVVGVFRDPTLPEKVRHQMVTETLQAALEGNHERLYMQARNMKVTVPKIGGGVEEVPIMERLPLEDQIKLTKAFEESQKETAAIRYGDYAKNMGLMKASWTDPQAEPTTADQLTSMIAEGVQLKQLTVDEQSSLWSEWAKSHQKKDQDFPIASAWVAGDRQLLFNLGADDARGAQAWLARHQKANTAIPSVLDEGFSLLTRNASPELSKILGNMHKGVVGQLGQESADGLQAAQTMQQTLMRIDSAVASGKGNSGIMASFLGAFEPDEARKIQRFRAELERNPDARLAAAKVMQAEVDYAKVGPDGVRALATRAAGEDAKLLEGIEPTQVFGTLLGKASAGLEAITMGLWTADPTAPGAVRRKWFEDPERARLAQEGYKAELRLAMEDERNVNPFGDANSRFEMASANVAARTLRTEGGPLTIPKLLKGQTVQDYFGVDRSVMPDTIAKALDNAYKPTTPDSRVVFRVINGQMTMQEFGPKSATEPVRSSVFDPKSIRGIVQAEQEKLIQSYQRTNGQGLTVRGSDDYAVTFNGISSVPGLSAEAMYDFRKGLVEREGVVGKQTDLKSGATGKTVSTIGVGLTGDYMPKPGPDGKISKQQLDNAFARASNDAANAAYTLTNTTKLGQKSFPLFAELAYHSGNSFANRSYYKPFMDALVSKNKEQAIAEFQKSPAWKDAGATRQQHYVGLINKALE